jgi:hypothetical protein
MGGLKKLTKIFGKKPKEGKVVKDNLNVDTMPSVLSSDDISNKLKTVSLLMNRSATDETPEEATAFWESFRAAIKEDEPQVLSEFEDSNTRSTLLHEVCKSHDVPVDVVQMVITICGISATESSDAYGFIPLHYTVTNKHGASPTALEALIDANPTVAHAYFSMELTNSQGKGLTTSPLYRAIQQRQKREILLVIHEQSPSMLYTPTIVTPLDDYESKTSVASIMDTPLNLLWRRYYNEKWECEKLFQGDNSKDEVLFHRKEYRAKACETRDTIMSMLLMLNFDLEVSEETSNHSATSLEALKGKGHIVHACASLACTAPPDLLKLIISKNPHDIDEADSKGKLPLHYAAEARPITKSSPGYQGKFVIQSLLELCPAAAKVQDKEGKLPLTLAFEVGKSVDGGLQLIYDAFPEAIENAKLHGVDPDNIDSFLQEMTSTLADDAIFVVQRPGVNVQDILGAMWAHETDAGLQMLAIMALVNMMTSKESSAKQETATKAIALAGGISSIVRAMEKYQDEAVVQEKACYAIRRLVSGATYEPYLEVTFAAVGAIKAVIQAMQSNPKDAALSIAACEALNWLANDTDSYTQIIGAGGIQAIMVAMEEHENNQDLQHAACTALARLVDFSSATCPLSNYEQLAHILKKASREFPSMCESDASYVLSRLAEV